LGNNPPPPESDLCGTTYLYLVNMTNIRRLLSNNLNYSWSFIFRIPLRDRTYARLSKTGKTIRCNNYKILLLFHPSVHKKIAIPSLLHRSRYYSRPDNLFNINEKGRRTMGSPLELRPFGLYIYYIMYIHTYKAYT